MPVDLQRELESLLDAACDGATVLTGNTRASRFLLAACDQRLGKNARAWETPDILPLSTWVQRSFRQAQVAGASELVLLNNRQSLSVWKQSIAESPGLTDLLRPSNASGHAAQAWTLVNAYRIPLSSAFESTVQAKAFAAWAKRYRHTCSRKGWTDSARVADDLSNCLSSVSSILPREIHLWGCGDLTPQVSQLMAALKSAAARSKSCCS